MKIFFIYDSSVVPKNVNLSFLDNGDMLLYRLLNFKKAHFALLVFCCSPGKHLFIVLYGLDGCYCRPVDDPLPVIALANR